MNSLGELPNGKVVRGEHLKDAIAQLGREDGANDSRRIRPDAKRQGGADVAEERVLGVARELGEILVRDHEGQVELAGLGEGAWQRVAGEAMELVEVHRERTSRTLRHRGESEHVDEKPSEELSGVFSNASDVEVGKQDPTSVHESADIDTVCDAADEATHDGIAHKRAELVENGGEGVSLKRAGVARPLLKPELADGDVLAPLRDAGLDGSVDEKRVQEDERRIRVGGNGEDGVAEHVLEPRAPEGSPPGFEGRDEAGGQERTIRVGQLATAKDVEGDRKVRVGRPKKEHIVGAGRRDLSEHAVDKCTVRVDEGRAASSERILYDQTSEQRRLARAGLADHPDVTKPVVW